MDILKTLKDRGFIAQMTHEDELQELLSKEKIAFYNGFDPTADSLHIGHYLTLMAMSHMQRAGHVPVVLMGGGTAMVGDPDKPNTVRPLMTTDEIDHNVACFIEQARRFIDFSDGKAVLSDNGEWLRHLNYVDFIREYGIHFSVNRMLSADKYRAKFEGSGLNFFELNYMLMQAYDFLELNRRYNCVLQTGGSDQWSNIIAGVELIRKAAQKPAYGLTFNLLTKSDGEKMGKTLSGALWLCADKTSPFEFYQYFRDISDADVEKSLKLLTYMDLDEIAELCKVQGRAINHAKEVLAFEVTKIVHGEGQADKAREASRAAFSKDVSAKDLPTVTIEAAAALNILDALMAANLAASKSEARRLITQGGVKIDGVKQADIDYTLDAEALAQGVVIQKGKNVFCRLTTLVNHE